MSAALISGVNDIRGLAEAVPFLVAECEAAESDERANAASELAIRHTYRLSELPSRDYSEAACKADVLAYRLGDYESAVFGPPEAALMKSLARDLRALGLEAA